MPKKHIVRKRIDKKKKASTSKSSTSTSSSKSSTSTSSSKPQTMTRLEYEQSMMDPRFRAAMMGFNNPVPSSLMSQMSNSNREQETRNNELARKMIEQQEQARLKMEYEKMKQEQQKELDKTRKELEETKRKYKDEQQIYKHNETLKQLEHDAQMANIEKKYQNEINDLQSKTNEIKRENDVNKAKVETTKKVMDAMKDEMIADIQAANQPLIGWLNLRADNITGQLNILNAQYSTIGALNDSINKLKEAQIKENYEPVIQELKLQRQEIENNLKLNQGIFDEIQKQNKIKTEIAQLNQTFDPKIRDEYNEKIRNQALETNKLKMTEGLASRAHDAYMKTENIRSDIVEKASQVFFDEKFDIKEVGTPQFNERLKKKAVEIQNKQADLSKQLELVNRQIDAERRLEQTKYEHAEKQAQLRAIDGTSEEHLKTIREIAEKKQMLKNEIAHYNNLGNELAKGVNERNTSIDTANEYFAVMMHNGGKWLHDIAMNVARSKSKQSYDVNDYPDILSKAKEVNESLVQQLQSMPSGWNSMVDDNKREVLKEALNSFKGPDNQPIGNTKFKIDQQIDLLSNSLHETLKQNAELQRRYNQTNRFTNAVFMKSTVPSSANNGQKPGSVLGDNSTVDYPDRFVPNGQSALRMTYEKLADFMKESGMTDSDLINIHNEIVNPPPAHPAPPVQTESV